MKKLTLSVNGDLAKRAKMRARPFGSLSMLVGDFLGSLDGEELATSLCRELRLYCDEPLLTPGEVVSRRPKAVGRPTSELVAELRRTRADRR